LLYLARVKGLILANSEKRIIKMVIIKTKHISATNHKGARIKASANGFSATISYPHAESYEKAHFEAVKALIAKNSLEWDISNMGYGSDENGDYYFTFNHSVMGA
jgi:hypothetical protein